MTTAAPVDKGWLIAPFLAPLQELLDDPSITEIMVVDDGQRIFVERDGQLQLTGLIFSPADFAQTLRTLAQQADTELTAERPLLEMRLPDGSRASVAIPPCSDAAALTIRRFGRRFSLGELREKDALTSQHFSELLEAVHARKNVMIAGGIGSGKTTLLNAMASEIPVDQRIVLLEDVSEIYLAGEADDDPASRPHVVRLQTLEEQRSTRAGQRTNPIPMQALMRHALRQRPDRLIAGEIRVPDDAFWLLHVFNCGHPGSMSTMHGNSASMAITRFAHLLIGAGIGLPLEDAKQAVIEAVDLIVYISRGPDGRKVRDILPLEGLRA